MRTTAYKTAALPSLILIGIGIFVISGRWDLITRLEVFGTAGGMVCGALAGRHIWRMSDWLDGLGRRGRVLTVLILATVLPLQMMIIALATGRLLVPQIHDEQMYLLQARQLAAFHLAMPALPLGEFFDTFYVLVKPVYASMYFPGTALAYVPAVWMHLPFWVWPVLVMTGMLVMTYLVAARIFGRLVALITVFFDARRARDVVNADGDPLAPARRAVGAEHCIWMATLAEKTDGALGGGHWYRGRLDGSDAADGIFLFYDPRAPGDRAGRRA